MNEFKAVLDSIHIKITESDYSGALALVDAHKALLLSSPDIRPMMTLIKAIPDASFVSPLQKLIKGWIAFLCGENLILSQILTQMQATPPETAEEKSLHYGIMALTRFVTNHHQGLEYARLSVEVLKDYPDSFYYANALLTYGQLLGSANALREAADAFYKAYQIFRREKCYFPAVVSMVNYGLKKHTLGEIADIIEIFQTELTSTASMDQDKHFFELLRLPLGIALFEINKQELAVIQLEKARDALYSMAFVHMFGVLEMYLTYVYALARRFDQAHRLLDDLAQRTGKLEYEKIQVLIAGLRVHLCLMEKKPVAKDALERLELDFLLNGTNCSPYTIMALTRLKLLGQHDSFDAGIITQRLSQMESLGNVPESLTAAILSAEYFNQLGDADSCRECLNKALSLFEKHHLAARLLVDNMGCLKLACKSSPNLDRLLYPDSPLRKGVDDLTEREVEILKLIADGLSNEEIAKRLYIGVGTTKWHITNLFSKLGVKRRTQALAEAKSRGLIPD
jgi:LuxR family maltose regulon positive regulatory protein